MKVKKTYYNDDQMTDSNNLSNALLTSPEKISPMITHLGGREDKKFPLTFLTEGLGNTKSIERLEYEYDVNYHFRKTRPLAAQASTDDVGANGQPFVLTFPDKWFIKDYILVSQSGVQARIMSEPTPNGSNWDYTMQLVAPSGSMPKEDLTAGSLFAQMYAPVGVDFSRGNASNWQAPARVRHKLTTIRKSYQFSGNAKDYVVEFDLPVKGGQTSRFWMDYEEWQHFLQWKEECEMYYWYGQQSYGDNGVVQMKDENGQPVQIGPGLFDQIINKDTYSVLTENKLSDVVGDIFFGMTDAQNMNVTLYTGTGGAREFDRAMKDKLGTLGFTVFSDGRFIQGNGSELTLTGYFKRYEHVDGHTINVVKVPLFDHGAVAQASQRHPVTGLPLESYRMCFVDQSRYDGQPNVQMINKKGREMVKWAVAGSVVPRGMGDSALRASDIDGASVHFLKTAGICLKRFDTSIDIQAKF
jgi:hypothetical protein